MTEKDLAHWEQLLCLAELRSKTPRILTLHCSTMTPWLDINGLEQGLKKQ